MRCFWWTCLWWRHHFRSTWLQEHFLQMLQASFTLLISLLLFVLSEPILQIYTKFLSMILHTWTNINISNWQFLIPYYHQNSQEIMLNTFCSNNFNCFPYFQCIVLLYLDFNALTFSFPMPLCIPMHRYSFRYMFSLPIVS